MEAALSAPSGAVKVDTRIKVTVFRAGAPSLLPSPARTDLLSRVFDFGPDGLRFLTPVTLVIIYTDREVAGRDESTLQPLVFNSTTGQWDTPTVVDMDTRTNTFALKIDGFSLFALGFVTPPGPACAANVDLDGIVDTGDMLVIARALGEAEPDLNGDKVVNVQDLAVVGLYFGEVCG